MVNLAEAISKTKDEETSSCQGGPEVINPGGTSTYSNQTEICVVYLREKIAQA